ncbi:MAG TPA: chemotaxis response regulator protein-glutamate methylesterase [bacterium]|nr:chemotaxis response regulator protein-glutamate methylesterase [bacterium]
MGSEEKKIRVMVVEDSAYMRYVLSEILSGEPGMEVVEKARDGMDALEKLHSAVPDVITLDVQMPRMDGLTFLAELRKNYRIPTIMISSLTHEGAEDTMRALELGAIDFVPKPSGGTTSLTLDDIRPMLVEKVRMAALIKPIVMKSIVSDTLEREREEDRKNEVGIQPLPRVKPPSELILKKTPEERRTLVLKKVVAIGCSTGGPRALTEVVKKLPGDLNAGIIVVQHMPQRFTTSLAERLNEISEIEVHEAKNGDKVMPGVVYIAPGDYHIQVGRSDTIYLNQDPHCHGVRPSVDVMMKSVAKQYGSKSVGVVMTGMGVDGRDGTTDIKNAGGTVFAEHESTCVVYGMPRVVVESGNADRVLILPRIADELVKFIEK